MTQLQLLPQQPHQHKWQMNFQVGFSMNCLMRLGLSDVTCPQRLREQNLVKVVFCPLRLRTSHSSSRKSPLFLLVIPPSPPLGLPFSSNEPIYQFVSRQIFVACKMSKIVQINKYRKVSRYTLSSTQCNLLQIPSVLDNKFDGFWTKYSHNKQILHFQGPHHHHCLPPNHQHQSMMNH
jgi:hypothetical protein